MKAKNESELSRLQEKFAALYMSHQEGHFNSEEVFEGDHLPLSEDFKQYLFKFFESESIVHSAADCQVWIKTMITRYGLKSPTQSQATGAARTNAEKLKRLENRRRWIQKHIDRHPDLKSLSRKLAATKLHRAIKENNKMTSPDENIHLVDRRQIEIDLRALYGPKRVGGINT